LGESSGRAAGDGTMDVVKYIHRLFQPGWVKYPADWKICARCGRRIHLSLHANVLKYGKWYHLRCAHRYDIIKMSGSEIDDRLVMRVGTAWHDPAEDIDPEVEERVRRMTL
jgi:hypothetical protein